MPTDLDYANLCAKVYAVDASTDKFWTHYWCVEDVVCGHVLQDGIDYLVFRGSVTPEDWMRDMNAIPVWHPNIGFVHAGFFAGLDTLYPIVKAVISGGVTILGHSLGAARACDMSGLFAEDCSSNKLPCPVKTLVTFGQPRPAFINLKRIIDKAGIVHRSYRNRNDPVPEVPFPFPLPFIHTEDYISLDAAPSPTDLEPLRDHHIQLYIQGVTTLLQGTLNQSPKGKSES